MRKRRGRRGVKPDASALGFSHHERLENGSRVDAESALGENVEVEVEGERRVRHALPGPTASFPPPSSYSLALSTSATFLDQSSANRAERTTTASTIHTLKKPVHNSASKYARALLDYSALPTRARS
jgi:hypothetical protein